MRGAWRPLRESADHARKVRPARNGSLCKSVSAFSAVCSFRAGSMGSAPYREHSMATTLRPASRPEGSGDLLGSTLRKRQPG